MAVSVNYVAGVDGGLPDVSGEKVVLRFIRPVFETLGMTMMRALHFL